MNTKFLEKYTIRVRKDHKGPTLAELASKHAKKAGSSRKVNISSRVDQILYGAK